MITPQQFKQLWEIVEGDRLISFPENCLSDVRIPSNARALLVEAGLPTDAAPLLCFGPPASGTLERASKVWHQPSSFDRYRILGGNGSGDPVCLDEDAEGQIVYLNHDSNFERVLMASSILTLAECLVQFRNVIADAGGDTELISQEQFESLLGRFRAIDPTASEEGGFWQQEFGCFQSADRKVWWRLWKR